MRGVPRGGLRGGQSPLGQGGIPRGARPTILELLTLTFFCSFFFLLILPLAPALLTLFTLFTTTRAFLPLSLLFTTSEQNSRGALVRLRLLVTTVHGTCELSTDTHSIDEEDREEPWDLGGGGAESTDWLHDSDGAVDGEDDTSSTVRCTLAETAGSTTADGATENSGAASSAQDSPPKS